MTDRKGARVPVTAPELLLKIVLAGTQSHYENRSLIDDARLEQMLLAGKQILWKSHQESDVRQSLGFSPKIWQGLTDVLTCAIPVLELQSFSWKNPPAASFNGSSSDLIAANYFLLVKDIERLNDLCTIARNLLATTKKAQNLAAEKGFDQQILKLIDICVRVTARGFDGETNIRNEERWQKVVNLYKRLLITCLQYLHNFIMHNEHRKLVLWLDLFGNSQQAELEQQQQQQQQQRKQMPKELTPEEVTAQTARETRIKATVENLPQGHQLAADGGLGYNIDDVHALFDLMSTENPPDVPTQEAARLLMDKIRNDMERLSGLSATQLDDDPEALLKVGASLRSKLPTKDFPLRPQHTNKGMLSVDRAIQAGQIRGGIVFDIPDLSQYGDVSSGSLEITDEDMSMPRTSQSAAETLQEAKDELMARLQDTPVVGADGEEAYSHRDGSAEVLEDDLVDSADDSIDDEDEDDEDYRNPGDQERGLLTDVPLVLGPTEIEALPMIIQAGIVDNFGLKDGERQGAKNMQAVRCHILLAQEAGRNVLRELLIFIAAWDLPDDEFYFKMMVQIMEAILKNGLMSHAYSDFGQAKDIISPAQAVVIKILTHIFRAKYSPASVSKDKSAEAPNPVSRAPAALSRVDVLTVRYIFTVFRGNIIPETCALIYLQGQIRAGAALAEDFPLNLWDMERVYEGVYQFLEFFAVLTESNEWKALLVEWEIVYDLVTLIKELDASIPKASFQSGLPRKEPVEGEEKEKEPVAVAVERPYDAEATTTAPASSPTSTTATADPDAAPPPPEPAASPPPPLSAEDPADFEWRNLKKLIVLVLSSLVWKSPVVQDQIREYGGLDVILGCTQYDGHNPYIKEHAVMCLKFLLEGNLVNQGLVGDLEGREVAAGSGGGKDGLEGLGLDAMLEKGTGRVKLVKRESGLRRRSSEGGGAGAGAGAGAGPAGARERERERFGRLDVNGGRRDSEDRVGRVIGEELDGL